MLREMCLDDIMKNTMLICMIYIQYKDDEKCM